MTVNYRVMEVRYPYIMVMYGQPAVDLICLYINFDDRLLEEAEPRVCRLRLGIDGDDVDGIRISRSCDVACVRTKEGSVVVVKVRVVDDCVTITKVGEVNMNGVCGVVWHPVYATLYGVAVISSTVRVCIYNVIGEGLEEVYDGERELSVDMDCVRLMEVIRLGEDGDAEGEAEKVSTLRRAMTSVSQCRQNTILQHTQHKIAPM